MKKSVYLETSVVSYLTARPSRDMLVASRQQLTLAWWGSRKRLFNLYVSDLVLSEAAKGDPEAVAKRMAMLAGMPLVDLTDEVRVLAVRLLDEGALPTKAIDDAVHVAAAAVHQVDYLLTWNCRHIDNAEKKPLIRSICMLAGYSCPEICTPEELMGDHADAG